MQYFRRFSWGFRRLNRLGRQAHESCPQGGSGSLGAGSPESQAEANDSAIDDRLPSGAYAYASATAAARRAAFARPRASGATIRTLRPMATVTVSGLPSRPV